MKHLKKINPKHGADEIGVPTFLIGVISVVFMLFVVIANAT